MLNSVFQSISSRVRVPDRQQSTIVLTVGGVLMALLIFIFQYGRLVNERQTAEFVQADAQATQYAVQTVGAGLVLTATYSASDAFIAEIAHSQLGMIRDGEMLVQPVAIEVSDPALAQPTPMPSPTPRNYELWWKMLFNQRPIQTSP
ncbi:MAG TPA: hypothetical protein PK299_02355 [Anaerolineales bacterium]|nr:hypothetical protein [Anaerolineales bacterium]